MTFNLAQAYTQVLSKLCIKYYKYLQYILNGFSEFNRDALYIGDDIERSVLSNILLCCTQLTFDLILSHRDYEFYYT